MAADSDGVAFEDDVIYLHGSANAEREPSEEEEEAPERAESEDFLVIGTFRTERMLGETRLGKIYEGHSTEDGRAVLIYLMETEGTTEADTSLASVAPGAQEADTSPSQASPSQDAFPQGAPSVEDGDDTSAVEGDSERVPEASGGDASTAGLVETEPATSGQVAAVGGGEVPTPSGGDVPGVDGGQVSAVGDGEVSGTNSGQVSAVGGGEVPANGGQVPVVNGGEVSPSPGGDVPGVDGGQVPAATGDEVPAVNGGESSPSPGGDDALDVLGGDSPAVTEAISVEAHLELLKTLEHMHVAPLIAWGSEPVRHLVYLAEGTSLRRILESGYKLSLSQALLLGLQAAETLDGFANDGMSHGDLRPENFLVDEQGRLRLAGLGAEEFHALLPIAAARRDDHYAAAEIVSVHSQSPPAQMHSQSSSTQPDPSAADIYALALTLAESILGRLISAKELQLLSSSGTSPSDGGTTTAKSLGSLAPLFIQAVQSEPSERPNAGEFALALRATAESLPKPQRFDAALERVREVEGLRFEVAVSEKQGFLARNLRLVSSVSVSVLVVVGFLLLFLGVYRSERVSALAVPDVVGMDWAEADVLLREQGWLTRRLEVRVAASRPEMVTAQQPPSGDLLEVGQVVKVQVSLGAPLVVVPLDLLGAPLEEARIRLLALGLSAGEIQRRPSPGTQEGIVLEIKEQVSEFPEGSQIDLVVSSAPAS